MKQVSISAFEALPREGELLQMTQRARVAALSSARRTGSFAERGARVGSSR